MPQSRDAKIGTASITTAKIQDAAITTAKITSAAIVTAHIADGTITNAKIGSLAVDSSKISDAAITTAKIADATITSAKISSIDANKINTTSLSAISANLGAITAGLARNASGTNFTNYNAVADQRFIQAGGGSAFIRADGYAEFSNAKVRGDIRANSLTANTVYTENIVGYAVSSLYEFSGAGNHTFSTPTSASVLIIASIDPQFGESTYAVYAHFDGSYLIGSNGNQVAGTFVRSAMPVSIQLASIRYATHQWWF